MKKIGWLLLIIDILIIGIYMVYLKKLENSVDNDIENYVNETSIVEKIDNTDTEENNEMEVKEKKTYNINYTAILEIPSISLKRGVVDSTNRFKSINYAISVDKSSNYPDEYGNFIVYAHSGNSSVAYFKNLNKVNINDDIYVFFNGTKYHYVIFDKYDIKKTGKAVIKKPVNDKYITLITCNQNKKGYQVVLVGRIVDSNNY